MESVKHKPYGPYEKYFKRPLDLLCGLAAVFVFWWLYIIIAILVRAKLGSPVLFTQDRPGKDGKIFKLYKFRSMTDARDKNGNLLPDEVRLTKFGRFLRSTSLDELPEFFNIVKGDMAVIGPRPLLPEYLPYYTETESIRHAVRPGLSGLAQVNGRNASSWEQTLSYDVKYVQHISLSIDIGIVVDTIGKVFMRSDVIQGADNQIGRFDDYRKSQWKRGIEDEKTINSRK